MEVRVIITNVSTGGLWGKGVDVWSRPWVYELSRTRNRHYDQLLFRVTGTGRRTSGRGSRSKTSTRLLDRGKEKQMVRILVPKVLSTTEVERDVSLGSLTRGWT